MRLKTCVVVLCLLAYATVAGAQIKGSGILKCAKPGVQHQIDAAPNHSFVLDQSKCSADKAKPFTINGVKSVSAVSTNVTEINGSKVTYHGDYADKMENGDTADYSFHGTGTMKNGIMTSADDSWTLVNGTGKLKGAKGKGTCKGTGAADGSMTWDCAGEYTLATK
jgi:hypothetical protein